MDIYAEQGHKIVFNHPTAGYESDQENGKRYLTVGEIYTVDTTIVGGWHTDVYILEVPNVAFNSVLFDDLESDTQTYSVSIHGCDDSTCFNMEMTNEEHEFLQRVADLANQTSSYGCQPTIIIGDAIEESEDDN